MERNIWYWARSTVSARGRRAVRLGGRLRGGLGFKPVNGLVFGFAAGLVYRLISSLGCLLGVLVSSLVET